MSYQGNVSYMPVQTVDEVADYTDMQGQASEMNQAQGKRSWRDSPTKALTALWFFIVLVYWLLGYFFRRHLR
jgi:uncharacterized membrane protein YgcG